MLRPWMLHEDLCIFLSWLTTPKYASLGDVFWSLHGVVGIWTEGKGNHFLKRVIYLAARGLSCSMRDLVALPGLDPRPPAVDVQGLSPRPPGRSHRTQLLQLSRSHFPSPPDTLRSNHPGHESRRLQRGRHLPGYHHRRWGGPSRHSGRRAAEIPWRVNLLPRTLLLYFVINFLEPEAGMVHVHSERWSLGRGLLPTQMLVYLLYSFVPTSKTSFPEEGWRSRWESGVCDRSQVAKTATRLRIS